MNTRRAYVGLALLVVGAGCGAGTRRRFDTPPLRDVVAKAAGAAPSSTCATWPPGAREVVPQLGPFETTSDLVLSRDGTLAVSRSGNHELRVWNATTTELEAVVRSEEFQLDLATGKLIPADRWLWGSNGVGYADDEPSGTLRVHYADGRPDAVLGAVSGYKELSPDAHRLVAYDESPPAVGVWDVDRRAKLWSRSGSGGYPAQFPDPAWSPDGSELAWASRDSVVSVADAATGVTRGTLSCPGSVLHLVWSPTGKQIATVCRQFGDSVLDLWDTSTWRSVFRLPGVQDDRAISHVAFAPDGATLAVGRYPYALEVRTKKGNLLASLADGDRGIWPFVWSRDGRTLLGMPSGPDYMLPPSRKDALMEHEGLLAWDVATGTRVEAIRRRVQFTGMRWSPDGDEALVFHEPRAAERWSVRTAEWTRWPSPTAGLRDVLWSPSGKVLAAPTEGPKSYGFTVWDANGAERFTHDGSARLLGFDPADDAVVCDQDRHVVEAYDSRTGAEVWSVKEPVDADRVFLSPDAKRLAGVKLSGVSGLLDTVFVWGLPKLEEQGHVVLGPVDAVTWDSKGENLLVATRTALSIWRGGRSPPGSVLPVGLSPTGDRTTALEVSADGRYVAIVRLGGAPELWDLSMGQRVGELRGGEQGDEKDEEPVEAVRWHPHLPIAAIVRRTGVQLVRASGGRFIALGGVWTNGAAAPFAFSSDGFFAGDGTALRFDDAGAKEGRRLPDLVSRWLCR